MDETLSGGHEAPHLEAQTWDDLIESLGPESILVLIGRWMGVKLRGRVSPEDIWQDTLLHAWRDRASHEWVDPRKYRSWLLAIAKNRIHRAAEYFGAQKRGSGEAPATFGSLLKESGVSPSAVLPGRSTTPSVIASVSEKARRMEEALASLDAETERVVRLHLFEEQSMQAIADELGIAKSTVWQRFRKGAQQYATRMAALEGVSPEPGPAPGS